jgi:enoyl-CoA hydratase/carnithine racemase
MANDSNVAAISKSPEPSLLVSIDGGVATLTFNRPERRNALTGRGMVELSNAYARLDADDSVRVIVLTGAGSAFCAGADLARPGGAFQAVATGAERDNETAKDLAKEAKPFRSSPKRPLAFQIRKPVIAAINGAAIGLGFTLALHTDIRYIAHDAKWGVVQVRRGVVSDAVSHWTLVRSVGTARAAELLLSGRTYLGTEAVTFGVASQSFPASEVLAQAQGLAAEMASSNSPMSMAMSKRILWAAADGDVDRVDMLESVAHHVLMGSADALEGGRAAFEKRTPQWTSSVTRDWPNEGPFANPPAPAWP